jgi:hypothetical protein
MKRLIDAEVVARAAAPRPPSSGITCGPTVLSLTEKHCPHRGTLAPFSTKEKCLSILVEPGLEEDAPGDDPGGLLPGAHPVRKPRFHRCTSLVVGGDDPGHNRRLAGPLLVQARSGAPERAMDDGRAVHRACCRHLCMVPYIQRQGPEQPCNVVGRGHRSSGTVGRALPARDSISIGRRSTAPGFNGDVQSQRRRSNNGGTP